MDIKLSLCEDFKQLFKDPIATWDIRHVSCLEGMLATITELHLEIEDT